MKIFSIFAGHDANIAFGDTERDEYHVIELERFTRQRYFRLHVDNDIETIMNIFNDVSLIAKDFWGMPNRDYQYNGSNPFWDVYVQPVDGGLIPDTFIKRYFPFVRKQLIHHHHCHACGAYYQSPFYRDRRKALIISYDGGGNDGFFNVFEAHPDYRIKPVSGVDCDFGGGYLLMGSSCKEVGEKSKHQLALAGKLMGLCGYGETNEHDVTSMKPFFIDKDYKTLNKLLPYDLKNVDSPWSDPLNNYIFEGQDSFNHAANAQQAFEDQFLEIFDEVLAQNPLNNKNVCLTGGCALNVLMNQRIKDNYPDVNLFVPPDPNDCGLGLGAIFAANPPKGQVNIAYNGLPLHDLEWMSKKDDTITNGSAQTFRNQFFGNKKSSPLDLDEVCKLLKEGKIIGVCRGDSEVGPRALGNRSIICDPSIVDMKDILNSKVKMREWYRPFAPFCLKSEASTYFESRDFENMEFMGYAPKVKEEYRDKLPAITHVDGTARLQTVTEESHKFFYDLLKTYAKYSDIQVLLNTSFNIRGNPILSTVADATQVLDETELDYLIIEDHLWRKK